MEVLRGLHCIGKRPVQDRPFLERAIVEMGLSSSVFIEDELANPDYISLWHKTYCDLSSFWKVYRRLKAESGRDER